MRGQPRSLDVEKYGAEVLRRSLNTPRGAYPPVAMAEIYCEDKHPLTKIRRLHLIVVDLEKTRSVSKRVYQ